MRTDLYRDPKVCTIAEVMSRDERYRNVTRNVMRNVTVGALVAVWGVARVTGKRQGDDLLLRSVTLAVVDDVADLPGFADAMKQVGWIVEDSKGLIFPRFFADHNVDPLEANKQKNAERQRRYRANRNATSNVTRDVTVTHREEKSREENNTPLTPLSGGTAGNELQTPTPDANPNEPPPPADLASKTFETFWDLFPRKENRTASLRFWRQAIGNSTRPQALADTIIAAVRRWLPEWATRNPGKVPSPAKWLEDRRWEDEPPAPQQQTETKYRPAGQRPKED